MTAVYIHNKDALTDGIYRALEMIAGIKEAPPPRLVLVDMPAGRL